MAHEISSNVERCHIRWMIRRDMSECLALEKASFARWTETQFLDALRQRSCIGMVAESGDSITGYMIYQLHRRFLEIEKIEATDESVMMQMINKLKNKLSSHRRTTIAINIHERNLEKQLFFKRNGFICTKIVRNLYETGNEVAFRMRFRIEKDDSSTENEE